MNERIQIGYYVGVVFKWLWLIILLVLVTSGTTAYFSLNTPKRYVSTERVILTPAQGIDLATFYATNAQSLADSYGTYMQSFSFAREVAGNIKLNPPVTPEEVYGAVNGTLVKANAVFFDVSTTSSSPERAQEITRNAVVVMISGYNKATKAIDPAVQQQQDDQQKNNANKITLYQQQSQNIDKQLTDFAQATPVANPTVAAQRDAQVDRLLSQQLSLTNIIATLENSQATLQAQIGTSAKTPAATIVDQASPGALLPSNTTRNIGIVMLLTFVFGIGMALLFDFLDFTIKAADDLENLLKVAPLGVIGKINTATLQRLSVLAAAHTMKESTPQTEALVESLHNPDQMPSVLGEESRMIENDVTAGSADSGTPDSTMAAALRVNAQPSAYQVRLITHLQPKSTIAEAFRVLRTNILFSRIDNPLRSMSVTSSIQGEGKTVTAGNLAVVFAQAGKTVLLIDADMRRPRLHTMFDLPNSVGFSNVCLEGIDKHPDSIYETSVRRLLVMPSGPIPPNPSELLGSRRVEELMVRVRDYIDIVIFDTPPAAAVTDAMVLATKVDGVLVVVQSGRTRRDIILKTFQNIQKVGGSILGPVLNQVSEQSLRSYYYYNYGYGYGYYDDAPDNTQAKKSRKAKPKAAAVK